MIGNYLGAGLNVMAKESNFKSIWIVKLKTHISRSQHYFLMGWVQRIRTRNQQSVTGLGLCQMKYYPVNILF